MTLTAQQIISSLAPRVQVTCDDPVYVLPEAGWLTDEFLPYFKRRLRVKKMRYVKDTCDCDDFAREFVAAMVESAIEQKFEAGVCCAILRVRNLTHSLGIPAGRHALNLVGVARPAGPHWWVVEPQNRLHQPLSRYETADFLVAHF